MATTPDYLKQLQKEIERIRIDCEREAIHDLILLLDKPVAHYIRKYLFYNQDG